MTVAPKSIGQAQPRREAERLVSGRGRYTDDLEFAGLGHVCFLRSPYAHARIGSVDLEAARLAPGVIAVLGARDLTVVCKSWQTKLAMLPGHLSPPQSPLADGEACWQGEPVIAVVAETRAQAEDAVELIQIEWEELPAIASIDAAQADGAPSAHSSLASNLGLDHAFAAGDPDAAFRDAAVVVEQDFTFERQTGVTLEPRGIVAEFDKRTRRLTVHHSHQVPFQMQEIFAAQLGLRLPDVRVITPDVGGAFGMKLATYPDDMAVVAIAVLLGRPVKFVADRLESFVSDTHAREARVIGRLAMDADGKLLGMQITVRSGYGAYSTYPRGSVGEGLHAAHMSAAPYRLENFRGTVRGYYQNKTPSGVLRAVGQPIACTVTEQLFDLAARKLDIDPAALRRKNYAASKTAAVRNAAGVVLSDLSLDVCHDKLLTLMNYDGLRREQAELRKRGILRGIGFAAFIEQTAVGSMLYGPQQVRVSANESCRLALLSDGGISCATSVTDQGQGTLTALRQIVGEELGVGVEAVDIVSGDTGATPFGGGAWASRGTALGGEAALRAAAKLKANILTVAGALLQAAPDSLSVRGGQIFNAAGLMQMSVADVAAAVLFRSHTIPLDNIPPFEIAESFTPRDQPYLAANGVMATYVEVDADLGTVRVLGFWVADDCGRVINPMLVNEQIRGGVVQGIGSALYEQCIYNVAGQMENASLADYLVPMASEMPDIQIAHVETPARNTQLGAKGVGEAGTVGAGAAVWGAVNDALVPLGATVTSQPITPEHILDCVRAARPIAG